MIDQSSDEYYFDEGTLSVVNSKCSTNIFSELSKLRNRTVYSSDADADDTPKMKKPKKREGDDVYWEAVLELVRPKIKTLKSGTSEQKSKHWNKISTILESETNIKKAPTFLSDCCIGPNWLMTTTPVESLAPVEQRRSKLNSWNGLKRTTLWIIHRILF